MEFKNRTISQLADMICGNSTSNETVYFRYRSSSFLTEFFQDVDTDYIHDGSTRGIWVSEKLKEILHEPSSTPGFPSDTFLRVIQNLMDRGDATNEESERIMALKHLNSVLARENLEAFYGEDNQCYLKHNATGKIGKPFANPHRPLTREESKKRDALTSFLDIASEDEIINEILLPLFRQIGFHRITSAGHKDKALEYGKDIWMRFTLPTQHILYFGIQAKKGKLDSSGVGKGTNSNVAEIYNQVLMMLGHEIFDPEIGKRVLVDHAFIVAGGEITKAARNWLGGKLDVSKRSQILFMDRNDILDLFVVNGLPLPDSAVFDIRRNDISEEDNLPF